MAQVERPTYRSVLQNTGFRYLWLNQILVQLAYNTLNFALIIWVFKLTDSSLAVSLLILTLYLPSMFFGLFAGVFVDIADRRKIIILIDFLIALCCLAYVFVKGSFPLILINTFILNSLAQFFIPAEGSSIPLLVNKKHLMLANSMFSLTLYGSFMIGFTIAGPILGLFGINTAFYLAVIAMGIAFLTAQLLPVIKVPKVHKKFDNFFSVGNFKNMVSLTIGETKETVDYIKDKVSVAVSICLLALAQGVIGVLAVIVSPYMEKVLHINATDASYVLMIPLGLGMIIGAYLIGRYAHNKPRRSLVRPSLVGAGIVFLLVGFTPQIAEYFQSTDLPSRLAHTRYFFRAPSLSGMFALGSFILGICTVAIIIPSQTVLQENTTEKMRGKIFAVLGVLMNVVLVIPVVLAGLVSDVFGPALIFIVLGAVIFVSGILTLRPAFFFRPGHLPFQIREFLGLGHWER